MKTISHDVTMSKKKKKITTKLKALEALENIIIFLCVSIIAGSQTTNKMLYAHALHPSACAILSLSPVKLHERLDSFEKRPSRPSF